MKTNKFFELYVIIIVLFGVLGFAGLAIHKKFFSKNEPSIKPKIVLLRTHVTTNFIPGYIGSSKPEWKVDTNGWLLPQTANAIAVYYHPRHEIVTNYVLGYSDGTTNIEIITVEK